MIAWSCAAVCWIAACVSAASSTALAFAASCGSGKTLLMMVAARLLTAPTASSMPNAISVLGEADGDGDDRRAGGDRQHGVRMIAQPVHQPRDEAAPLVGDGRLDVGDGLLGIVLDIGHA